MRSFVPDSAQLSAMVDRIVASEAFSRSERARCLLQYLVREEQAGNAARLKGFSIAVDVFGKDSEFDASTDAQVRVQAGRLRELLDQYFATEGADEPIRITIPRGSYVPVYSQAEAVSAPAPAADVPAPTAQATDETSAAETPAAPLRSVTDYILRQLRMLTAAVAVVIAMLAFVAYQSFDGLGTVQAAPITAAAATAIRMAEARESLPKVRVRADSDPGADRVATLLRSALAGFDTIILINKAVPDAAQAKPLDFALDVDAGSDKGSVDLTLTALQSGEVIATRTLVAADTVQPRLDDAIADFLTATMPVSGAMYAYVEAQGQEYGLTKCLLLNDEYYLDQTADKHQAAYQCFEKIRDEGVKSPLIFSELAALQLEAVTDKYSYPALASKDVALQLARKAIQMAPTSPYAHRAYGFVFAGLGNGAESIKWMKKSYELGRFDMNMSTAYGYALIMAGNYAEGVPVIHKAVEISSAHPSWWDYTLFLGAYMLGDDDMAADATDALATSKRPHYIAARLLAATVRGQTDKAAALLGDLRTNHANFADNPRAAYVKAGCPQDMVDKLSAALARAGLASPS